MINHQKIKQLFLSTNFLPGAIYTVFKHSFVIQLRFKSGIHKSELKKMNYVFSVCTTQATTEHEDSLHRGVILENNI